MSVALVVGSAAGAVVMEVELRVVDMMTGFTLLALLLNECLVLGGHVPPADCPSCFHFQCWIAIGVRKRQAQAHR